MQERPEVEQNENYSNNPRFRTCKNHTQKRSFGMTPILSQTRQGKTSTTIKNKQTTKQTKTTEEQDRTHLPLPPPPAFFPTQLGHTRNISDWILVDKSKNRCDNLRNWPETAFKEEESSWCILLSKFRVAYTLWMQNASHDFAPPPPPTPLSPRRRRSVRGKRKDEGGRWRSRRRRRKRRKKNQEESGISFCTTQKSRDRCTLLDSPQQN